MLKYFIDVLGEENVLSMEPMAKHTTFRVGGPADYYLIPQNAEQVRQVVALCKEKGIPYFILGNGSNLLVSDDGYRGAIVQIFRNMSSVVLEGEDVIRAQAGALLSTVARTALNNSLTNMEFASGIPGTLGGAVTMNAGAYGGEMKDILYEVTALTEEGEVITLKADELELGYRTSCIKTKNYIVLEAAIKLEKGDKEKIQARMDELKEQRVKKQPLEFPSAGSTFKRPAGYFAGKLIQDAGLAGFKIGGAEVSAKHCGFVINSGNGTAKDIMELIHHVQKAVWENAGVKLEMEVKRLGSFQFDQVLSENVIAQVEGNVPLNLE